MQSAANEDETNVKEKPIRKRARPSEPAPPATLASTQSAEGATSGALKPVQKKQKETVKPLLSRKKSNPDEAESGNSSSEDHTPQTRVTKEKPKDTAPIDLPDEPEKKKRRTTTKVVRPVVPLAPQVESDIRVFMDNFISRYAYEPEVRQRSPINEATQPVAEPVDVDVPPEKLKKQKSVVGTNPPTTPAARKTADVSSDASRRGKKADGLVEGDSHTLASSKKAKTPSTSRVKEPSSSKKTKAKTAVTIPPAPVNGEVDDSELSGP
jgi:hypothetical protein